METKRLTRKPDTREINVDDDYAVDYWAKEFGVAKRKIFAAGEVVGTSASKVRSHLKCKYVQKED